MAVFTRRQIQHMLNGVAPWLDNAKSRDLIKRLDHKSDPDQVIPAEYELAIGWGLSQVADFEFEPAVGKSRPDFFSPNLFPDRPAIIEVAAISDDSLSGESSMRRTANIIGQFADTVRKKASKHLYFQFFDKSGYEAPRLKPGQTWGFSQYYRYRMTSHTFRLSDEQKAQIATWLGIWPPQTPLHVEDESTSVQVTWKDHVHSQGRVFSSMPSLTHSLTDNPIYRRLKEKENQLRHGPHGAIKCVVLGDAGCRLLRIQGGRDSLGYTVSGEQIIHHFLKDSEVDVVAAFSPRRNNENALNSYNDPRRWFMTIYASQERDDDYFSKLLALKDKLPPPYLHGYQARSWLEQGMLDPQAKGQYKPTTVSSRRDKVTIQLSARAVVELMAGRLAPDRFLHEVARGKNYFEIWLEMGFALSNVEFQNSGIDRDDDLITFHFEKDPNASPLVNPVIPDAESKS